MCHVIYHDIHKIDLIASWTSPYEGSLKHYLLAKFQKLTILNLTKLVLWEACSIGEHIVEVLYHLGNINAILNHENFVPTNPLRCWWLIWPIQNNAENLRND